MKRVILLGTTTGTTWRQEVIESLVARKVPSERIVNPHLPHGVKWTPEHMRQERIVKRDPRTLILIYVCPGVVIDQTLDEATRRYRSEMLGAASMKEVGQYGWGAPHRTAVVLDYARFTQGGRSQKTLIGFVDELIEDFGPEGGPLFGNLSDAVDWIAPQLARR